jgi:predicted  nucleic acid-binding Zn-ribbon protein
MSDSFHLFQLQKVDRQLDQIKNRLAEITALLAGDEVVRQAREKFENQKSRYQSARQALKRIEDSVQDRQIKKEQSESSLYGGKVRNPKELQDLQNEVASIKRAIAHLEDQQIEAMIQFEEAEKSFRIGEEDLAKVLAKDVEQHASLLSEKEQLLHNEARLQKERSAITSQLTETVLNTYTQLRQQKRGTAVATVEDDACQACGNTLTPAKQQAARSPQKMFYCPSCGRILYSG